MLLFITQESLCSHHTSAVTVEETGVIGVKVFCRESSEGIFSRSISLRWFLPPLPAYYIRDMEKKI